MNDFFQQVFTLLTTNPGNLVYNLVLAFSVVAAGIGTINQWRSSSDSQAGIIARRVLLGLSMLLVIRLGLFVAAGLAWQRLINAELFLPLASRGADLLSLLVIIWLWVFPEPSWPADLATIILAIVILGVTVLGVNLVINQGAVEVVNGSPLDQYAHWGGLILAGLGILLLIIRRPLAWPIGVVMIAILGVGAAIQILLPGAGDYPGAVRLSQIIVYPLLLVLPSRIAVLHAGETTSNAGAGEPLPTAADQADLVDPVVQGLVMDWVMVDDPRQAGEMLGSRLAQLLQADLCLFLWPPNSTRQISQRYGYDLIHQLAIPDILFDAEKLPIISLAFDQGHALRLPGNSKVPDLISLAEALDLKRTGSLLSVPVLDEAGQPMLQAALLSPFSGKRWTAEDQSQLAAIVGPLAHILQHNRQIADIQDELMASRQALTSAEERVEKVENDRSSLMDMITILQQNPGGSASELPPAGTNGEHQEIDQAPESPKAGSEHE
jgi:hypothetical protein